MVNRAAVILKYWEPAVRWINEADPYDDDPGITLSDVNEDKTVYLIRNADAVGRLESLYLIWLYCRYENGSIHT